MADLGENVAAAKEDPKKIKLSWKELIFSRCLLIISLGSVLASFHAFYASGLFAADRSFGLLSPLEREMSLKTEMGFYYSYYKTIVEEKPLVIGLSKIMYDRIVEYPKEVNAINRFNIHPEVVIGALFNYLEPYLNETVECYGLDRGDLPEVDTCSGMGEPIYFYLEVIFWLSGLTVAMLFYLASYLCGTPMAGLLCILLYMCNHMDATRVMWTPNERENFAQPFLLTQMFLISVQLRKSNDQLGGLWLQFVIVTLNCICLLCWQFTQFIFLTQIVLFFFMEQLRIINARTLCVFLHGHFCGIHLAMLLLQGNDMLKTSLYVCVFLVLSIYGLFFSYFRVKVRTRLHLVLEWTFIGIRTLLLIKISIWLKKYANYIFETDEDSHVFDIFFSKLGLVKSFHTMMYTCSAVFDFMPYATWVQLTNTGLIPLAVIAIVNLFGYYNYVGKQAAKDYVAKKMAKRENTEAKLKPDEKCVEKQKDEALENLINAKNEDEDDVKNANTAETTDTKDCEKSKDDNCVDNEKEHKATETQKDDKSAEKSEDGKSADTPKDAKSVEKSEDGKSADTPKDAKSVEKSEDGKSADTPKDAKSVEKSEDGKSADTPKDAKSVEKSEDGKSADTPKDAKSVEKSEDGKSADTPKDAKSVEKSEDGKSADTPKDAKSAGESNDADSTEKSKDGKSAQTLTDTKSTQTPISDADELKDPKALEQAKDPKATKKARKTKQNKKNEQESDKIVVYLKNLPIDAALFYNIAQMAAFGLMAALVMRLKLLFVPHLCIVAACSCDYLYYTSFSRRRQVLNGIIIVILVGLSIYKTWINMKEEMSYIGQYSDVYLEELLKWIAEETSSAAVFAGPMPVTAVVMLTTRRAIVNHPHYENADARHRNYIVYKMYGRFPPQKYHDELSKLKVTHLIIDKSYCYGESTKGCSFSNIWDIEYPSLKRQPLLCHKLISGDLKNFYMVFDNPMYTVLWVHDYSIKYNPKLLNT